MSQTKLIIIGGVAGVAVVMLLLFLVLGSFNEGNRPQVVTLQFWGTFDDSRFYSDAITDFNRTNPSIRVIYKAINFADYEKQLIDSFAAGTGPDIWLMHNTWLAKHGDKIEPLPQQAPEGEKEPLMTLKQFQEQFVDVAAQDLVLGGQIYAMPLYIDTLALYYNKDLFNTAGIVSPPKTWEEFNDAVKLLTSFDSRSNVSRAGAAVGTARNINRSTDILALLMIQSGVKMTDENRSSATFSRSVDGTNVGETALQYYTDFANPLKQVYTWNDSQSYSIDAFINGDAAMMLNYSHHIQTIRDRAARFSFGVAPMPQIAGAPVAVNFANYWAPTVAKQSKNQIAAWKFLTYLSSARGDAFYVNASNRPSARRDLLDQQKTDPDLGIFATQALSARSWYQVDSVAIETIFAEMIDAVNYGRATIQQAIQTAENKVSVLMARSLGNGF